MSNEDFTKAIIILALAVLFVIGGSVFLLIRQIQRKKNAPPPTVRPTQLSVTPQPIQQASRTVTPMGKPAYSYDDVEIFVLDAFDLSKLRVGDPLTLIPEPNNEHDPKAVAVIHNGYQLGYLHRNRLQRMYHDFMKKGGSVTASIAQIKPDLYLKLEYFYLSEKSTVYASPRGKCFHLDPMCFTHEGTDCIEMTVEQAQRKGLTPCGKCIK